MPYPATGIPIPYLTVGTSYSWSPYATFGARKFMTYYWDIIFLNPNPNPNPWDSLCLILHLMTLVHILLLGAPLFLTLLLGPLIQYKKTRASDSLSCFLDMSAHILLLRPLIPYTIIWTLYFLFCYWDRVPFLLLGHLIPYLTTGIPRGS